MQIPAPLNATCEHSRVSPTALENDRKMTGMKNTRKDAAAPRRAMLFFLLAMSKLPPMSCPTNVKTVEKETKIDELPPVFYKEQDGKCDGPFMTTYSAGKPGVMTFNGSGTDHHVFCPGATLAECKWK